MISARSSKLWLRPRRLRSGRSSDPGTLGRCTARARLWRSRTGGEPLRAGENSDRPGNACAEELFFRVRRRRAWGAGTYARRSGRGANNHGGRGCPNTPQEPFRYTLSLDCFTRSSDAKKMHCAQAGGQSSYGRSRKTPLRRANVGPASGDLRVDGRARSGARPSQAVARYSRGCVARIRREHITLAELRLRWQWDPLRADPRFQRILQGPEPKTSYR